VKKIITSKFLCGESPLLVKKLVQLPVLPITKNSEFDIIFIVTYKNIHDIIFIKLRCL